jgi:hypothetical protein
VLLDTATVTLKGEYTRENETDDGLDKPYAGGTDIANWHAREIPLIQAKDPTPVPGLPLSEDQSNFEIAADALPLVIAASDAVVSLANSILAAIP